ncbi:MAG: hypothetical protein EON88_10230 [Brevundimonas sp.]|nr:MAG: hypothetical protein EON88_10230 [Brevundimonas sp.]
MLIALLLLADPSAAEDRLSPERLIAPPTVIQAPAECGSGFTRIGGAEQVQPVQNEPGVSRYLLLDRRDEKGCAIPISFPVDDNAIGRELGRGG